MQVKRSVYANLVRLLAVLVGFQLCPVDAQKHETGGLLPPWAGKPSPAMAASLAHWRLKFVPGEPINAPEKGDFSVNMRGKDGTARLVNGSSMPIKLTPVTGRTRYVPEWDKRTDPRDKVVNHEVIDLLRSHEITRFLAKEHVDAPQLNIEKNFAVALVKEFDAALREPGKKEHVWSINWRVANEWIGTKNDKNEWTVQRNDDDPVGYSVWGLFTKVNGVLKPFHIAATRDEMIGASPYYYFLAVGDLDGNGIDEMIVSRIEFEAEEANLELWAWEHDGPVAIQKLP